MNTAGPSMLIAAGCMSALACVAHVACIWGGGPVYRLMGAGERMARAAEAGRWQPTLVTLAISIVLALWAGFAFSGAGVMGPWPGARLALPAIAAVLFARAFGFPWLKASFPDNSELFWWVSSGICFVMAALYALGTALQWQTL